MLPSHILTWRLYCYMNNEKLYQRTYFEDICQEPSSSWEQLETLRKVNSEGTNSNSSS